MNFVSRKLLSLFLLLLAGEGSASSVIAQNPELVSAPEPQIISTAPDGKFIVRREKTDPSEHGEARKSLEICSSAGKVLYAWVSGLGVTKLLWSSDSSYLAVNDTPGEQGDMLRLFALDPIKLSVTPIREPNGKKLIHEEEVRHGSFLSTVDKIDFRAAEWREGRLWCLLTGSAHPKRQPTVHIPFHHFWVFGIHGTNIPVLQEEWTLTDPRERAVRDPYQ